MWTWLQANQGPILALGTVGLFAVTTLYVFRTGALARSAERSAASAERLVQLDVLPLVFARSGTRANGSGGQSIEITVRNVGRTAALNVYAWFRIGEEDSDYMTFGSGRVALLLKPGDEATSEVEINQDQGEAFDQEPSVVVAIASYQDAFGGYYKTEWKANDIGVYKALSVGPPVWEQLNISRNHNM